jgi:hypothetical protein
VKRIEVPYAGAPIRGIPDERKQWVSRGRRDFMGWPTVKLRRKTRETKKNRNQGNKGLRSVETTDIFPTSQARNQRTDGRMRAKQNEKKLLQAA